VPSSASSSSGSSFAAAFQADPNRSRWRTEPASGLERTRPTTVDEAVAALRLMREYTPTVPGSWSRGRVGGLSGDVTDAAGDRLSVIESGRGPTAPDRELADLRRRGRGDDHRRLG
jgi:hypothetical protein